MTEALKWIDAGASEIDLNDFDARVLEDFSGFGMPPVDLFAEIVPFEDGAFYVGMVYRPKVVNLGLRLSQSTRSLLFSERQTIANAFNPSRGPGQLMKVFPDGTERRLDCYVIGGLDFDRQSMKGPAAQGIVVQLKALNPFWFDATQKRQAGNFNGASNVDIVCNNAGGVPVWPVIEMNSTCQNPVVTNVTTGKVITISGYTIGAGRVLTIDCGLGKKTAKLDTGTNVIGYLTSTSVLYSLAKGNNTIRFTATAGNTGDFSVAWYNRYLVV